MKARFAFSALVFLVAMTMATGAFAQQGIFTLSAGSEARGRSNGHAEEAGGITLFLANGALTSASEGKVVIDYGVPITNELGEKPQPISGVDQPDPFIGVTICGGNRVDGIALAEVDDTEITITINGTQVSTCSTAGAGGSINVDGVLLSLVGSGATEVMATVSVSGDVRLGGANGNRATVIDSVVDPLTDADVKVGQKLTLIRHSGDPADATKTQFHLVITEPHNDSFDGGRLELSFSGIPEDVELVALDAWVTSKTNFDRPSTHADKVKTDDPRNQIPIGSPTQKTATADDDDEVVVYLSGLTYDDDPETDEPEVAAGSLDDKRDVVVVRGSIKGADDEDLLPIDLDIQVTVDLGPIGDDDDDDGHVPRFDSDKTTAMTVIESTPSRTTLKVPYVLSNGTFDTGIAVSNMSTGSSAQPGPITFDFYVGGTKMTHATSAGSPGSGLNESGMLMPGGTYSALLSQLFPGNPGGGYLIITTDFTAGDGNVFISDFAGFSATGSVRQPKQ